MLTHEDLARKRAESQRLVDLERVKDELGGWLSANGADIGFLEEYLRARRFEIALGNHLLMIDHCVHTRPLCAQLVADYLKLVK